MTQWLLPSFIALFAWGFWAYLPKHIVNYLSPKSAAVYEILGAMILGAIVLLSMEFKIESHPKGVAFALATGMLGTGGSLAYLYAVSRGPVALVSVFTALYPVVTLILAYFILNEAISFKQACGVVLALVAIYLITS